MNKNIKVVYCIVSSIILSLLNNPIFQYAKFGIDQVAYTGNLFAQLFIKLIDILSLIGFILLIVFSIILIVKNINLKDS